MKVIHIYITTNNVYMHKKYKVHVPYEKQQQRKRKEKKKSPAGAM